MKKIILTLGLISQISYGADFSVQFSPENNSVSNLKIQDNAISTEKIQDGAVTASKLANGIIDDAKVSSISSSKVSDLTTTISNQVKTKFRKKNSSLSLNSSGVITDVGFSNLTVGKIYRITASFRFTMTDVNDPGASIYFYNASTNTNYLGHIAQMPNPGVNYGTGMFQTIITAVHSNLRVTYNDSNSGNLSCSSTNDCFVIVEELPNHESTNIWD